MRCTTYSLCIQRNRNAAQMIKIENCENNRTTVSIKMEDGMKDLPAASGHTATTYRDTVYALDEHIDDFEEDLEKENLASEFDEAKDASWGEVCQACCIHSPLGWVQIAIALFVLVGILYFFLFGLELLGTSAMVVGGCTAGSLFGSNTNPIAAVMIGMMSTALIQSSSTTTSIIVSLVSGGLDVKQAIYMIMGTNIGSTITSMLVAMGHMGDGEQLERAFAGASIHEIFNVLSVCILLPIEILTHYLFHLTRVMLPGEPKNNGESWEGPIKKFVTPLTHKIIKSNKKLIEAIAGDSSITCDSYYPVYCEDGVESYDTCTRVGLIACDKDSNECPLFFRNGATKKEDHVSGGVCLFLGIFIIIICLVALVTLLQRMLLAVSSRIIYKTSNINPYLAMIVGSGITMLVQSSSTTISILTPLTGLGLLTLEQMFPLTLGANIGTSVTALMAASVQDKIESLHVALAHLFFNVAGILIWYPIPYMRYIPLTLARGKGKATRLWRGFPVVYVTLIFFVFPLLLLGISALFEKKTPGYTALGGLLVILVGFGLLYFTFWWKCREGRDTFNAWMAKRERHHVIIKCLPENMDKLNALPEVVELLRAELASLLVEKADGTPEKVRDISSNATICTQEGTSTRHHEDIGSMKIEEGLNNPVLEQMPSNLSETYD